MKLKEVKTDEYTIKSGHLPVGNGHEVYFEQWGNKDAETPIIYFHGGPGHYFQAQYKYNFDPKQHQVIGFDQRGCGNSLPYGKLEKNTTADIIDDAVKILDGLGLDKAYVYGGSWGSTLALLFSIKHQNRTKATIATGIFTGSKSETEYIVKGFFKNFYPEVWQRFLDSVPANYKSDPIEYHYKILVGKEKVKIIESAKALLELEGPLLRFDWQGYREVKQDKDPEAKEPEFDYVPYQIYAHYLSNGCFLPDRYVIKNTGKIQTPLYIVQGRYDMVCPPATAYELHKAVPGSQLYMTLASHGHDPENRTALKILINTVFI